MATNRKPQHDASNERSAHLATWDELGRTLASLGTNNLETALAAARELVDSARDFGGDSPRIGDREARRLAERLASDCTRIVEAGGGEALWGIIVDDRVTPHPEIDALSDEGVQRGRLGGDPDQRARIVHAATRYGLAVFARCASTGGRDLLRELFGTDDTDGDTLTLCAPFAINNDLDDHAFRWRDAAAMFANATTDTDRLGAVQQYTIGFEHAASSFTLEPTDRLGLIAWVARRGLRDVKSSGPRATLSAIAS